MNKLWNRAKMAMGIVLAVAMMAPTRTINIAAAIETRIKNPDAVTLDDGVTLSKTAKAVDGKVNTWDVTLRVEAPKIQTTSATVMVIDTSSSMGENGKMDRAKDAAKALARQLLPVGNTTNRVAIVSFNNNARVSNFLSSAFSGAYSGIENRIGNLQAQYRGGTFTQEGIREAAKLLANINADIKSMVLLSDGEPTYNYAINNPDGYLIDGGPGDYEYEKQTSSEVLEEDFDYETRVGSSEIMWGEYDKKQIAASGATSGPVYEHHYYNSGNCAIAEAGYYKESGNGDLYTVALDAGEVGQNILGQIATTGKAYTATVDDLNTIFGQIGGKIVSAMQVAEINDTMGDGIVIADGSSVGVAGASNIDEEVNFVYDDVLGKYVAEITYRVEATDDIANNIDDAGFALLNKKATIEYGSGKSAEFPVPMVKPTIINITEELVGREADEREGFVIELTRPDGASVKFILRPGETKHIAGGLVEGEYSVKEINSYNATSRAPFDAYLIEYFNKEFNVDAGSTTSVDVRVKSIFETIDVTVVKYWDDDNDRDDLRKNYNMYIMVNEEGKDLATAVYKLDSSKSREMVTMSGIKKYRNGEEIKYVIGEGQNCEIRKGNVYLCEKFEGDDDYTVKIDGEIITNTHAPEPTEQIIVSPCLMDECSNGLATQTVMEVVKTQKAPKAPETGAATRKKSDGTGYVGMFMGIVAFGVVLSMVGVFFIAKYKK